VRSGPQITDECPCSYPANAYSNKRWVRRAPRRALPCAARLAFSPQPGTLPHAPPHCAPLPTRSAAGTCTTWVGGWGWRRLGSAMSLRAAAGAGLVACWAALSPACRSLPRPHARSTPCRPQRLVLREGGASWGLRLHGNACCIHTRHFPIYLFSGGAGWAGSAAAGMCMRIRPNPDPDHSPHSTAIAMDRDAERLASGLLAGGWVVVVVRAASRDRPVPRPPSTATAQPPPPPPPPPPPRNGSKRRV
jgi:hypothetical protein